MSVPTIYQIDPNGLVFGRVLLAVELSENVLIPLLNVGSLKQVPYLSCLVHSKVPTFTFIPWCVPALHRRLRVDVTWRVTFFFSCPDQLGKEGGNTGTKETNC